MENILKVLTTTNLLFILKGLWLTLQISFISIVLSTIFGTILAVMRNGKNKLLKLIASIYIEFVRNVPNLLWIFTIFLVFQIKSTPAGIISFPSLLLLLWQKLSEAASMPLTQVRLKLAYLKDLPNFRYCVISSYLRLFGKCCQPSFLSLSQ